MIRGKGGKERLTPMGEFAAESLKTYLESGRLKLLKKAHVAEVFINARGEGISRQGIWKIIKSSARKAGITINITPHMIGTLLPPIYSKTAPICVLYRCCSVMRISPRLRYIPTLQGRG